MRYIVAFDNNFHRSWVVKDRRNLQLPVEAKTFQDAEIIAREKNIHDLIKTAGKLRQQIKDLDPDYNLTIPEIVQTVDRSLLNWEKASQS